MPNCQVCGKQTTQHCKGCNVVWYCSYDCQRQDWKHHKTTCQSRQHLNDIADKSDVKTLIKEHIENDPKRFYMVLPMYLDKARDFAEEIEKHFYPPSSPTNQLLDVSVTEWQCMMYAVLSTPLNDAEKLRAFAKTMKLKLSSNTSMTFDGKGNAEYFPINGENVNTLAMDQ